MRSAGDAGRISKEPTCAALGVATKVDVSTCHKGGCFHMPQRCTNERTNEEDLPATRRNSYTVECHNINYTTHSKTETDAAR